MFTFGSVILETANVPNRFIKGCFSGIATSKQSTDKQISGELCVSSLVI